MSRAMWWYTISGATFRNPATLGNPFVASTTIEVRAKKSAWDVVLGTIGQEMPLTLATLVQVEGTDFPFYTREAVPLVPRGRRWARPDVYWAAEMPLTIFATLLSEDLLFFSRDTELPTAHRIRERNRHHVVVRETFQRPFIMPALAATAYQETVCKTLSEIQRHLLELPNEGASWMLWSEEEARGHLDRRIARFLKETGLIRERRVLASPGGVAEVDVPEDALQLRRVAWTDGISSTTLERIDKFQLEAIPGWETETADSPYLYVEEDLSIRLYPIPLGDGNLDIIIVPLLPTSGCDNYPIPSIFAPFIKWGVIADLLRKEGEANDPERAKYAEGRFVEGIELGRLLLGTEV